MACILGGMPEMQVSPPSSSPSKSVAENTSANSSGTSSSSATSAKKPPAKTKSLIYIVAALAVAAGIFFWLRPQRSTSAASSATAEPTLQLETFIVNLEGAGQRAYLRVGITLGLSHPLSKKKEDVPIALVRDAILYVLANAQPEQLLGPEGKQKLKAEILKALQESAPELGVDNVYFTEFLVQM